MDIWRKRDKPKKNHDNTNNVTGQISTCVRNNTFNLIKIKGRKQSSTKNTQKRLTFNHKGKESA